MLWKATERNGGSRWESVLHSYSLLDKVANSLTHVTSDEKMI